MYCWIAVEEIPSASGVLRGSDCVKAGMANKLIMLIRISFFMVNWFKAG
jgi:N-acetylmuramic acid 6-phosphate (MurNAc-6-P) etherase